MCRWFAYFSPSEPCLIEDVLVTPAHALSKQVHQHYLPMLLSHSPSDHPENTTRAEITTRNRLFNVDGFGMAWYTDALSSFSPASAGRPNLHPALYKTIQPPLHDTNFRSICSNTSSKVVFAHIRAATATAIAPTNNHPFTFGIYTIMHNGYISDFAAVKRQICDAMSLAAYSHIQGSTDTEIIAALFMTFLSSESKSKTPHSLLSDDRSVGSQLPGDWETYHSLQEIKTALSKTIAKIITIQIEVLGEKAEPNDLNIAITNGNSFVACRFRNHATEQPPSLYYSTTAGVTLNRQFPDDPDGCEGPYGSAKVKSANGKQAAEGAEGHNPLAKMNANEHGNHVIIASEPTTYKNSEWALIQKNQVVLVGASGTIETVETLSYPGNGA